MDTLLQLLIISKEIFQNFFRFSVKTYVISFFFFFSVNLMSLRIVLSKEWMFVSLITYLKIIMLYDICLII